MSFALLAQALNKINEVAASVATAITNIAGVKTATDAARTDITAARDNINTATNAARDNNNTTTNAARDNIKSHVSSAVAGVSASAVNSVQNVLASGTTTAAVMGGNIARLIPISAVNANRAVVFPGRILGANSNPLAYRIENATQVRVEQFGSVTDPGAVAFSVVEFKS